MKESNIKYKTKCLEHYLFQSKIWSRSFIFMVPIIFWAQDNRAHGQSSADNWAQGGQSGAKGQLLRKANYKS